MAKKKKVSDDILSRVKPVSSLGTVISALFYGRSGTGKTTISSSFPKPMLLIDIAEKGTDSISDVEGIDVFRMTEWSELEEIFWRLQDGDTGYKTVVIDAMHSLQDLAIDQAKVDAGKAQDAQTSMKDFGKASGLMKQWILNYVDLTTDDINVVFLAHDRITESDTEGEDMITPEVGPRLMPSTASTMTGSVNIVGHSFIKETIERPKKAGEKKKKTIEYCMRIGPHAFYTTKIRKPKSQILPDFIVDPDFDQLLAIVKGDSKTSSKGPLAKKKVPTKKKKVTK